MAKNLYHFKPKGLIGDQIMPLNRLRALSEETYAEQAKKYEGREELLLKPVPPLGCLWNDVLHLSPIHPQRILDFWRKEGLRTFSDPPAVIEVLSVPASLLSPLSTTCFQAHSPTFDRYDPSFDRFWPFDPFALDEPEIPALQIEYWRYHAARNQRFLWFSHSPTF